MGGGARSQGQPASPHKPVLPVSQAMEVDGMWTRGDTYLGGQAQPRSAGLWVLEDRALCTGTGSEEVSTKG